MRLFTRLILFLALLFVGGFVVFAATLPRAGHFDLTTATTRMEHLERDQIGIVALTGGGGARIDRALSLYEMGLGDRVLISGTHPTVRKADLSQDGRVDIFDCCVDLGPWAKTTIGNGIETRDWVRKNGYAGIYLVTSDFHLRRATLELRSVTDDLVIVGVPVSGPIMPEENWLTSPAAWRILTIEYVKYLLSAVRTLF